MARCSTCHLFTIREDPVTIFLPDLFPSAESGCAYCMLLITAIETIRPGWILQRLFLGGRFEGVKFAEYQLRKAIRFCGSGKPVILPTPWPWTSHRSLDFYLKEANASIVILSIAAKGCPDLRITLKADYSPVQVPLADFNMGSGIPKYELSYGPSHKHPRELAITSNLQEQTAESASDQLLLTENAMSSALGPTNDIAAKGAERRSTFELCYYQEDPLYERVKSSKIRHSLSVVENTNSPAAFERATAWLNNCVKYHDGCKAPVPEFFPSRLIDVGPLDGKVKPFLCNPKEPVSYAALSYCWGQDLEGILSTTLQNLTAHYESIHAESLPRSIFDALLFCRDDDQDWQQESGQMRHIYSNAYVTLAADHAASCQLGFLGKQSLGMHESQVELRASFSKEQTQEFPILKHSQRFLIRLMEGTMASFPPSEGRDGTSQEDTSWLHSKTRLATQSKEGPRSELPLHKRGWTLQEDILSMRTLSFTGKEMIWRCNQSLLCECNHEVYKPQDITKGNDFTKLKCTLARRLLFYPPGSREMARTWKEIVQQYSRRTLTRKTDKLSAISGVAQLIEDAIFILNWPLNTYIAGIWQNDLAFSLTWRRSDGSDFPRRPLVYRAPTWSWASIDGPIEYDNYEKYNYHVESHLMVVEGFSKPQSTSDPTGAVENAYIIVTGLMVPVEVIIPESYSAFFQAVRKKTVTQVPQVLIRKGQGNQTPATAKFRTPGRGYIRGKGRFVGIFSDVPFLQPLYPTRFLQEFSRDEEMEITLPKDDPRNKCYLGDCFAQSHGTRTNGHMKTRHPGS
ncbi:hypothetical protein B0J14DRAFT_644693 [Halenospora varia]|nr:hypothetical protein B0J14DRAFT_644693 [Halenospora varia]